jgi:hypothetical protein
MERTLSERRDFRMRSAGIKRVIRTFLAWQEEKEEKWLSEMSKKGWHLARVGFFNYTFKEGAPRDYAYRFDFKILGKDDLEDYKSTFEDAGWEYIGNFLVHGITSGPISQKTRIWSFTAITGQR